MQTATSSDTKTATGSMSVNRPDPAVEELKNEIHRLLELQRFALDRVTYLGMTQEEANGVHARRKKIGTLVDQLATLRKE